MGADVYNILFCWQPVNQMIRGFVAGAVEDDALGFVKILDDSHGNDFSGGCDNLSVAFKGFGAGAAGIIIVDMGLEVAGDVDGLAELTVNGIDELSGLLKLLLLGINEEVAVHVGLELFGHTLGFSAEAATVWRKITDEEPLGTDLIFGKEPVGDG